MKLDSLQAFRAGMVLRRLNNILLYSLAQQPRLNSVSQPQLVDNEL